MTGIDDWHGWLAWMTSWAIFTYCLQTDRLTDWRTDRLTLVLVKSLSRLNDDLNCKLLYDRRFQNCLIWSLFTPYILESNTIIMWWSCCKTSIFRSDSETWVYWLVPNIAHLGLQLCSSSTLRQRKVMAVGGRQWWQCVCQHGWMATLANWTHSWALPQSVSNHAATRVARLAINWQCAGNKQTIISIKTKIKSSDSPFAVSILTQHI